MHIKWQKFNTEMKYTTDTLTMSYMSYLTGHSSCQITYVAPLPGVTAPARCLLLCRLSTDCSCLQGTSTSSGSCRVDICSSVVFHRLQGQNLLHYWPAGESLLQYVEHLLLLLFWLSDLLAKVRKVFLQKLLQSFFSLTFFLLQSLTAATQRCVVFFFLTLSYLMQRSKQHSSLSQLWTVVDTFWSQLELALSDTGQHSVSSLTGRPCNNLPPSLPQP